ncbi:hypothetical protein STAQ_11170 [Allostella sp. ATCC 35155]|nr:hypothetical protein STAQ_11170 [Stella sp. ATCC 35155]
MANYTLQILHASDFEAGVDAIDKAPKFAAIVDALEETYDNTLILSSGDNFIPGPFLSSGSDPSVRDEIRAVYNELYGLPADINGDGTADSFADLREGGARLDVAIMNTIGVQASALGNHEFDLGTSPLRDAIGQDIRGDLPQNVRWLGADFPYLSANLDFSNDANLAPIYTSEIREASDFEASLTDLNGATDGRKIAPATIITVNGEQIGVVGATTPELERISSPGDTEVMDPGAGTQDMQALAQILQPTIDALLAQGIDKIILVSHLQQLGLEQQLAPLLKGVDIIIAGGSHTLLADSEDVANGLQPGDSAAGPYPIVTQNADGDPLLIVNTDSNYEYVGRLVVEFDDQGKLIPGSVDPDVSGAFASTDETVEELWGSQEAAYAEGTKGALVQELVSGAEEVIVAKDGLIFGQTDVFLEGRRAEVRTEETNLGNMTADANLARGQQVDETVTVSIKNGGGIREPIGFVQQVGLDQTFELPPAENELAGKEEGEISRLDIENSLRFNNGLTLLTVSREQLVEVLEHAVRAVAPGATPGQFAQVSGVAYSYDPDLPAGDRIVSAALTDADGHVMDVLVQDGEIVGNPDAPVRIITLNFMADGGDGYPFKDFLDADPAFANRVDLASEDANANGVLDAGEDLNQNGQLDLAADIDAGAASFAASSSEQDALADYIAERYSETPYDIADTGPEGDERIQNLNARGDSVLDGPYDLAGTAGDDLLTGTAGADTISGDLGADTAVGQDGMDLLFGGQGNDLLLGGTGSDYILAGRGNDTLEGGADADPFLNGNLGDDLVRGGAGDDRLWGGKGNDTLEGGAGADTLSGDRGDDLLSGGEGADRFVYQPLPPAPTNAIQLDVLGSYDHGGFDEAAAETLAFDPATDRLFVSNAEANTLDVLDLSDPSNPKLVTAISLDAFGGGVNSVATKNGIVAAAVASDEDGEPGTIAFFDTDGNLLGQKAVGVLPDMITFTADGSKLLVANEGERVGDPGPDQIDPPGSISIIDLAGGIAGATVTTLGFGGFEAQRDALIADGLRVTPGKTLATDLEPEYITVTPDGTKAYVSIQEANAFAVVDLQTKTITELLPLGYKDYDLPGNGFDASDRDDSVAIRNWPVKGIYEPDAIASFQTGGQTYIITANEGDARSDGSDEARLGDLELDPTRFPNADELQENENLGRLNVSSIDGDTDGDGDLDEIVVFGGRSFSIFDANGNLVFDSGDQFEAITAAAYPNNFNADNGGNDFDNRSDNKGPEPEAVAVGVVDGRTYAFVGLERVGGVMVYDVTDPANSQFVQYLNNRDFTQDIETAAAGDSGPEVVQFVAAADSPTGKPMLLVANEISGTTTVYDISDMGGVSEVTDPGYDRILDFDLDEDRIVLAAGLGYELGTAADGDALLTLSDGQQLELHGLSVGQVQPLISDLVLFA